MTPQETDKDLSGSVQKSPSEAWFSGGLLQGWGAVSVAVLAWEFLKKVFIIFITSTIVWPQDKQQGGNTVVAHQQKIRFMEHGPAHQNKTQFLPQSVSAIRKLP